MTSSTPLTGTERAPTSWQSNMVAIGDGQGCYAVYDWNTDGLRTMVMMSP
jgi:hypothetical protein